MIRKLTRKAHVVAVLIVFVALSALAQTTSAGQTPEQSFAVSVPAQASTPARLLLRSLLPGASNTQRISAARLQGKEAVAAAPDSEGVSFLPSVTYSSGCLPWSVVVGDVNGDGHPDLVVANWYQSCTGIFGPGAVRVLPGNGDGTFQSPVSYGSGGFQALSVAIGDFNGDGKLDLAVANDCAGDDRGNCANGGAGQVGVLMGNGDGTFSPPSVTLQVGPLANRWLSRT